MRESFVIATSHYPVHCSPWGKTEASKGVTFVCSWIFFSVRIFCFALLVDSKGKQRAKSLLHKQTCYTNAFNIPNNDAGGCMIYFFFLWQGHF